MAIKNPKDYLWPFGGTLLGLVVVPVAIAQYPHFFNENSWLLPVSSVIVLFCWVLPLVLHDRMRHIYRHVLAVKRWGVPLFVFICAVVLIGLFFGFTWLLDMHRRHLEAVLPHVSQQSDGEAHLEVIQVSVHCDIIPLPILIPPGGEIGTAYLNKLNSHDGILYFPKNSNQQFAKQWPSADQIPSGGLKCKAQDHGAINVVNLRITFRSRWGLINPQNVKEFWAKPPSELDVVIDVLEPNRPYTFYLVNQCHDYINVHIPTEGTAKLAGEDNSNYRRFDLLGHTSDTMGVGPTNPEWSAGDTDCN
jgi:hypothetical protein